MVNSWAARPFSKRIGRFFTIPKRDIHGAWRRLSVMFNARQTPANGDTAMTYQLFDQASHYRPVAAAQSKGDFRRMSSISGLLRAVRGWIAGTFRRPAVRPNSPNLPAASDWNQQFRRDMLKIEARRIL